MRTPLVVAVKALDLVLAPLTLLAAAWLKVVRRAGVQRMGVARAILRAVGVFPVRDHYYEPLFHPRHLTTSLRVPRDLPGIELDVPGQLELLERFHYQDELRSFPMERPRARAYHYNNAAFGSGDAEYLYSVIRHFRPRRIVEIGSGYSTLLAASAVRQNRAEDPGYACEHLCIEPYERPWLESVGVRVIRDRVERAGHEIAPALGRNDILFIDSSHVIRPQGDILFEYLQILPRLASGVLVHVHDIFTPRDLPDEWILDRVRFWNEQYLLEGFLSCNRDFRVVGAVNLLKHDHFAALAEKCPALERQPEREPGSFWMVRN